MPTSLRDSARFIPLANLVAQHGIRNFVEVRAEDTDGIEAAKRLKLRAFVHNENTRTAEVFSQRYMDAEVYDGDPLTFLRAVLPSIDTPTYFLLDRASPTFAQEEALIREAASRASLWLDWFVDAKGEAPTITLAQEAAAGPLVWKYRSEGVTAMVRRKLEEAALALDDAVSFDKSEEFDRNWIGPPELAPRVYRTQSEKDTWHAVVVDNEYKLGPLDPADVVLDIGAHIGSFSYLAHLHGSRNVHGFEVDPWHMKAQERNLEGFDGIFAHYAAVVRSDEKRKPAYFYDGNWNVFAESGREVQSISLDQIIDLYGRIRFLKTDTEGSEWPILYTCTKLDQVDEIAGEYHEGVNFHDNSLPPCKITSLALYLWERWGYHVTYTNPAPGIGNFYAKRTG